MITVRVALPDAYWFWWHHSAGDEMNGGQHNISTIVMLLPVDDITFARWIISSGCSSRIETRQLIRRVMEKLSTNVLIGVEFSAGILWKPIILEKRRMTRLAARRTWMLGWYAYAPYSREGRQTFIRCKYLIKIKSIVHSAVTHNLIEIDRLEMFEIYTSNMSSITTFKYFAQIWWELDIQLKWTIFSARTSGSIPENLLSNIVKKAID